MHINAGDNMKKKKLHRMLVAIIAVMLIIIGTFWNQNLRPSQLEGDKFDIELKEQEVMSAAAGFGFMNFPRNAWRLITGSRDAQMRFFLRSGFAFGGTVEEEEIYVRRPVIGPRIGQNRDATSDDIYMLTWQPEESFVRRANLIHETDEIAVPDARYINFSEPLVYIFNSHPAEMIGAPSLERYREGTTSIIEFSHMIANILDSHRIPTMVEDRDVRDLMNVRGWGFAQSYLASRIFLEERINQYPTLQFFFDIHREGVPDSVARREINGQSYATIVFVIGLDNPAGYLENLEMAYTLHRMLEEVRPGISRAVFYSYGLMRDGVYNQDVSPKLQLIEIGSAQSTIDEMVRTTEILANVLAEYILLHAE